MTRLLQVRIGIAVIGVIVWGYGVRFDEPVTRMVGIGLFLLALLLRFAARRAALPPGEDDPES